MVGNSVVNISTSPTMMLSSKWIAPNSRFTPLNSLSLRPRRRMVAVKAASSQDTENSQQTTSSSSSEHSKKNPLAVALDIPRNIWRQTLRPLSDFGFGRRSIWEGGVGLFLVSGTVLLVLSLVWLRAFQLKSRFRKYLAVFEFAQACGICTGTPVRIRGVTVGNVIRVNPSLKSIEAVVEVEDDKTIIPRNSLIEVNQSGLLMETMIDITPRNPSSVGPLCNTPSPNALAPKHLGPTTDPPQVWPKTMEFRYLE